MTLYIMAHPLGNTSSCAEHKVREPFDLRARLGIDRVVKGSEGQKGRAGKGAQCLEGLVRVREEERAFGGDTAQRRRAEQAHQAL